MIRILANDGIAPNGLADLEAAGFEVSTEKIAQDALLTELNNFDVIIVRSATKVRKDLIDASPNLKAICRGGVGIDNIDHEYAKSKGIPTYNTPAASSVSVAELVFAHFFGLGRFLQRSNFELRAADSSFDKLKKAYGEGREMRGKTLGIIGFGRIGIEAARIGLGLGMKVLPVDPYKDSETIELQFMDEQRVSVRVPTVPMDTMLAEADYITVHVPGGNLINAEEFAKMKDGVILANTSRGGVINEDALLAALATGKVAGAALDVFVGEPNPRRELLEHPKISITPHIGAATEEAQYKIGTELADQLKAHFGL
ncbi:NAD(P)-dependent oxidoreductase [Neolewinella lacunae]|uniref:3-phosphoglycerate dehydrogenase n=1 Tax=Neolewinella lacunae TaxID=1517758 RepID=A0A923PIC2_9BACT|nr:NAD(P)-dependent oxidoreductase [Neolewinella lacunae]MBC6993824.1 3-phosphoglycerate dehydrogenase [Neolewinella lacunae]MDN3635285.1 NAD(P)-dependent oxidoreductase [Neolewinella lacunae]